MDAQWNRRDFVRMAGFFAAVGGASAANAQSGPAAPAAPSSMAGRISAIALVDDGVRLAMYPSGMGEAVPASLGRSRQIARLGSSIPGDAGALALLEQCRSQRGGAPRDRAKLALVSGWLFHRAFERQRAPLYPSLSAEEAVECGVYQDVTLLREMSFTQPAPCNGDAPSPDDRVSSATLGQLEELFQAVSTRLLIGIHTFNPDSGDADTWMKKMKQWDKNWKELLAQYANVYRSPDTAKWRRFVQQPDFYDRQDAVVRICRSLQKGGLSPEPELRSAMETSPRGLYGKALRDGFGHLQAASAYVERSINKDSLMRRLDLA
jgi:hypothetical protein